MATAASPYLRHRFPPEIIAHCVLLYIRFPLSFRAVEEMMLLRGVQVSHETIRRWCRKFGQQFANELRRRRPGSAPVNRGHAACAGWLAHPGLSQGFVPSNCLFRSSRVL